VNPFTLPVHPAIVHFPMAMLAAAWASLVLRYLTGRMRFADLGGTFELVGVLSLPLAVASGVVDTRGVSFLADPRWDAPLIWHVIGAIVAGGFFTAHYLWRRRALRNEQTPSRVPDLVLPTLGFWLLVVAGLIAGEMVYAR
jgi:uncharacterized membrane protein